MYRIEKRFTLAGGHRLSKHAGRCYSFHGHNYIILVGIKSSELNSNDMVMDFSELKDIVNKIIDPMDHCMVVNECDMESMKPFEDKNMRIMSFGNFDPTAEKISEIIFKELRKTLSDKPYIDVDYVTVYENENSKATYSDS